MIAILALGVAAAATAAAIYFAHKAANGLYRLAEIWAGHMKYFELTTRRLLAWMWAGYPRGEDK